MTKRLVITRYREQVDWLAKTDWPYLIYNKGEALPDYPCKTVPNIGRDSETIIRYVLEHYYVLPDLLAFVQGNPFPHCPAFLERLHAASGYTELGTRVDETNHPDFPPRTAFAKALLKRMGLAVPDPLLFVKGMQYVVPKEMLCNKSYTFWLDLYYYFRVDERNGWFYEMIWPAIFQQKA